MKKKIGVAALLVVGFLLFLIIRFAVLSNTNVYGRLKVVTSPASSVFVNNVAIGKVPYEDKYKAGEYLLKLIPEDSASETASWQRKVTVNKNTLTYVNIELGSADITTAGEVLDVAKTDKVLSGDKGEVSVDTEPSGAIIYLDNDEKGVASVTLSDVPKGDHELSVFMPGFFRRNIKINIVPGYHINAYVKLAVDPNQSPNLKIEELPVATQSANKTSGSAAAAGAKKIKIFGTPEGFLNVRMDASVTASKAAEVKEGEIYSVLHEKGTWYEIEYANGQNGWISSEYTREAD